MAAFEQSSRIEPSGEGRFRAVFDDSWLQGPGVYGGLTAATLFRATEARLGAPADLPDWRLRSMALQYLAPVPAGAHELEVEVDRQGTGTAFTVARLRHQGRVHVHALATFGRDRSGDLDEDVVPAPTVPAAESLPAIPWMPGMPVFTRHLDLRFAAGIPYAGGAVSRCATWMRFRDPPAALDTAHAIGLLDSPPPAFLARATSVRPASTVTFQLHLLRPPPPDPAAFWLAEVTSSITSRGWSDEEIRLTGPDGRIVAIGRQLVALVR